MFGAGEDASADLVGVLFGGLAEVAADVGEAFDELGGAAVGETGHVPPDEDLGVGFVPAPMPTVGMVSLRVIWPARSAGTISHDDGDRAGFLDGDGVGDELVGAVAAALDAENRRVR